MYHPEFFKQAVWVMDGKYDHVPHQEVIEDFMSGVRSASYIAMAHFFMNQGTELGFLVTLKKFTERQVVIQHYDNLSTEEKNYVLQCAKLASAAIEERDRLYQENLCKSTKN